MKSLVLGAGEVGRAMYAILAEHYDTEIIDKDSRAESSFEILHVCFPYSEEFVSEVKKYQKKYSPKHTVIHATVPVGTSRECDAIHSPIRGLHPDLVPGIKTFVKFLGGERASGVADYFRRAGLKVVLFDDQETTEAGKLFDTEYYRVCIEFAHRVKQYCDKHKLNFSEVYRIFNQTYNEGYELLGHKEFVRPILEPIMKEIGGHCVLSNKELIKLSEQ